MLDLKYVVLKVSQRKRLEMSKKYDIVIMLKCIAK